MKLQIALIGYGAIGAAVHRLLLAHADQVELVAVLVRDRAAAQAQAPQAAALMVDRLPDLLQRKPSLVVECAGHQAVDLYGVAVLQAGVDLLVVSFIDWNAPSALFLTMLNTFLNVVTKLSTALRNGSELS